MLLKEWNTINQILLEIYSIRRLDELTERLFKMFNVLVPYSQGYFIVFEEHNRIDLSKSRFIHMNAESRKKYLEYFYEMDYLNYIFEFTVNTSTYRDTDILEEEVRKNTDFYREFLQPQNIPYGCGIVLLKKRKMIGIINLFRSREMGNFSDRDMVLLDILKLHLENILVNLTEGERAYQDEKLNGFAKRYRLSLREQEVMALMKKGFSNIEMERLLSISLSTVKKHVFHIYGKTGVKSRTQLLALLHEEE